MTDTEKRSSADHAVKPGEAVDSPQKAFGHPMEVVETPELPPDAKEQALETWEADEKALQRASEEGMTGGEAPRLQEVKKAQRKLKSGARSRRR